MVNSYSAEFKRYFSNSSWMMMERIIRLSVSLFVAVYVARYLGPEQFGLLSYAISFVSLFSFLANLGLDEIAIRQLVRQPEARDDILGSVFCLKLAGALVMMGVITFALLLASMDNTTRSLILIVALATFLQSLQVIDFYFQSQVLAKFSSKALLLSLFLASAVRLWLIAANFSLVWFAWAILLENAFLGIGLLLFYRRQGQRNIQWRFQKLLAVDLLRQSLPLCLSGMVIILYMRIDQVMIKEILGNAALGNYAAAVKVSEAWYMIPITLTSALFPAIIQAKETDSGLYYRRLQKLYDLLAWLAITIALSVTAFRRPLVHLLFGPQYEEAATVLALHIWAGVFVFLGVARGKWILAENLQKYSLYFTGSGAILNILLNLLLIPVWGIQGAATATLITYAASVILLPALIRPTRTSAFQLLAALNPTGFLFSVRSLFHAIKDKANV